MDGMRRVPGRPYHDLVRLRAWDFSSVDVLPHVFLDRAYEAMEGWSKANLWPVLEHAMERRIMAEACAVNLEREGRPLAFPDDRALLVEVDGWTVFHRRHLLFECSFYRLGRKEQARCARALITMVGVEILEEEFWGAVPGPLAPEFADRVEEYPGDHGLAAARYQKERRRLAGAEWIGHASIEGIATPHRCEFTDMGVFMNHAPQLAADCGEAVLARIKAEHPALYPAFAELRVRPLSLFAVQVQHALWGGDGFEVKGCAARAQGRVWLDFEVWTRRPRRLCERFLAAY
jgi:hypothetical protein